MENFVVENTDGIIECVVTLILVPSRKQHINAVIGGKCITAIMEDDHLNIEVI